MIHPADAANLGLDFATDFQGIPRSIIPGVGVAEAYFDDISIELEHLDGTIDRYEGRAIIAIPSDVNAHHPSLLGRDVFDHYRIVYHHATNTLELHEA